MKYTAHAPAIHCEGCAASIQRALGKIEGVQSVQVETQSKTIQVEYQDVKTSATALAERLSEIGFPPEQK